MYGCILRCSSSSSSSSSSCCCCCCCYCCCCCCCCFSLQSFHQQIPTPPWRSYILLPEPGVLPWYLCRAVLVLLVLVVSGTACWLKMFPAPENSILNRVRKDSKQFYIHTSNMDFNMFTMFKGRYIPFPNSSFLGYPAVRYRGLDPR